MVDRSIIIIVLPNPPRDNEFQTAGFCQLKLTYLFRLYLPMRTRIATAANLFPTQKCLIATRPPSEYNGGRPLNAKGRHIQRPAMEITPSQISA